ncbi:MAG: hypothetical protein NTY64_04295, partial [Deltaproteobacteria bacterium]|nr:hypothetical protein [Deltaproteobacteria bacterium]
VGPFHCEPCPTHNKKVLRLRAVTPCVCLVAGPGSEKAKEMGVEVIPPAMGTPKEESLSLADFSQTEKGKIAACPQGHAPVRFKQGKKNTCSVAFAAEHCGVCPLRERCPVKSGEEASLSSL